MNAALPGLTERMSAQIRTWLRLHGHALFSSLGHLWRAPWMTCMTLLVIAVTLVLPLTFYLTFKNLQFLGDRLAVHWQISLYLQPRVQEKHARQLAERLKRHPAVARVRLIDKQTALAEFRRRSGFGDVLAALPENPLPIVLEVLPHKEWEDLKRLDTLIQAWQRWQGVDFVQWDMRWLHRLKAWLALAERGAVLLGALLGMAVILVVGNTVRLELEDRREEIEIMKLLGATNRFIRRPFLYSGFWYGLAGGMLAWLLAWSLHAMLRPQAARLAELYGSRFSLHFASFEEIVAFWGGAVLLAMAGAWLVVTRHLWHLRP